MFRHNLPNWTFVPAAAALTASAVFVLWSVLAVPAPAYAPPPVSAGPAQIIPGNAQPEEQVTARTCSLTVDMVQNVPEGWTAYVLPSVCLGLAFPGIDDVDVTILDMDEDDGIDRHGHLFQFFDGDRFEEASQLLDVLVADESIFVGGSVPCNATWYGAYHFCWDEITNDWIRSIVTSSHTVFLPREGDIPQPQDGPEYAYGAVRSSVGDFVTFTFRDEKTHNAERFLDQVLETLVFGG